MEWIIIYRWVGETGSAGLDAAARTICSTILRFPVEPEKGKRWSVQGVIIIRRITVNISVCSSQRERPVQIVRILNGA